MDIKHFQRAIERAVIVFTEFHGMERWLLIRALKTLEMSNHAAVMEEGVKFF
jgi:hypothetical protein